MTTEDIRLIFRYSELIDEINKFGNDIEEQKISEICSFMSSEINQRVFFRVNKVKPKLKHSTNFLEINIDFEKKCILCYFSKNKKTFIDPLKKIIDISSIGICGLWFNHDNKLEVYEYSDTEYILFLIKQSYEKISVI
jgi:predicted transport protein